MQALQDVPSATVAVRQRPAGQAVLDVESGARIRELRASRARLVVAADEERRRIERDLHDGAQQRLLSLRVKLGVLDDHLGDAGPAVRRLVDELASEAERALTELQALVRGIYPPVLVDRGLTAALNALASDAPMCVTVNSGSLPRYPAGIEAAVYFCCVEAVQNATKHAGRGARIVLSIDADDEWLAFEARDDGVGVGHVRAGGTGLMSMRDRVGAVGGDLQVVSAPGRGTTVRALVPLRDWRVRRHAA